METDVTKIKQLTEQYRSMPASQQFERDQLLDELQDLVGLAGKMATEKDILKRADAKIAAG